MRELTVGGAYTLDIGPFMNDDGITVEAALVIVQADIKLTKNGDTAVTIHHAQGGVLLDAIGNGFYKVSFDATDSNTGGFLTLTINMAGCLPVWEKFTVLAANVTNANLYDMLAAVQSAQTTTNSKVDGVSTKLGTPADTDVSTDIANAVAAPAAALVAYDPPYRSEATTDKEEILAAVEALSSAVGYTAYTDTVTVTSTGAPIENATVTAYTGAGGTGTVMGVARSAANGTYTLYLPAGTFYLKTHHPNYAEKIETVVIP